MTRIEIATRIAAAHISNASERGSYEAIISESFKLADEMLKQGAPKSGGCKLVFVDKDGWTTSCLGGKSLCYPAFIRYKFCPFCGKEIVE